MVKIPLKAMTAVPVVDVVRESVATVTPSILLSFKSAEFIALDIEVSGIGQRMGLMSQDVEARYANLGELVKTRAMLSLGISCFCRQSSLDPYRVHTFDISMFCNEPYIVEPSALLFLNRHGFDFNKQIAHGVPYTKGEDASTQPADVSPVRDIFSQLLLSKKPIVVHNGLLDLAFLYGCLYAPLPSSLPVFVADLCEMFQGGIFDSKYIAEYQMQEESSFLEYLFRKNQRKNAKSCQPILTLFQDYTMVASLAIEMVPLKELPTNTTSTSQDICTSYALHGHCKDQSTCNRCHDIDVIIDNEGAPRKRKRNTKEEGVEVEKGGNVKASEVPSARSQGHRAGFDAFMTGYTFAVYRKAEGFVLKDCCNQVYLSGKPRPLAIAKRAYTSTSPAHKQKQLRLSLL